MRFFIFVAFLALIVGAFGKSDGQICREKNRDAVSALNKFCGWTYDLVVPSPRAKIGTPSAGNKVLANVNGNCSPAQWVPRQYCLSQFYKTCARGKNGLGIMKFGRNGCQQFTLSRYG